MKRKSEITRYRNGLKNSIDINNRKNDEEIRNKIRNWLPDVDDDKVYQLQYIVKNMERYIEDLNTPPKTYEEYLVDRQEKLDRQYWSIMMRCYSCEKEFTIDMWSEVEKIEKLYLIPKLRKLKLDELKK